MLFSFPSSDLSFGMNSWNTAQILNSFCYLYKNACTQDMTDTNMLYRCFQKQFRCINSKKALDSVCMRTEKDCKHSFLIDVKDFKISSDITTVKTYRIFFISCQKTRIHNPHCHQKFKYGFWCTSSSSIHENSKLIQRLNGYYYSMEMPINLNLRMDWKISLGVPLFFIIY